MTSRHPVVAAAALLAAASRTAQAQGPARVPAPTVARLEPNLYLISGAPGNLVVLVTGDSAVVAGPQAPALTAAARALLTERKAPHVRYVVVTPADSAAAYGDGGWGRRGAVVFAYEGLRYRILQRTTTAKPTPPAAAVPTAAPGAHTHAAHAHEAHASGKHTATAEAALPLLGPSVGFSQVIQFGVGDQDVHVIRERPGATGGDPVVHFENANTVYLGELFTPDGYPDLQPARGGAIAGLIETVAFFRGWPASMHFVPARGPARSAADLGAYVDMLVTVRDRVQRLIAAGRSAADAVTAKPTADLDARWGRGPISADRFVAAVYQSLAPTPPPR